MKKSGLNKIKKEAKIQVKDEDLVSFVGFQFMQLAKKNLGLPFRLFHL